MSTTTTVLLGIDGLALLGAMAAGRRKSWTLSFLCAVITVALAYTLLGATSLIALAALLAVLAGVLVWLRRGGTASTVTRWGARSRRKTGVASTVDIARRASAAAMRRKATVVRPSLREVSVWARWRTPVREFAVLLCRSGRVRVFASIENVIVVFGGPRFGKSEWLKTAILDAPGAVLVTSTRTDLHDETGPLRARVGPVYVFNPTGLGDLDSTITFDPLTGCAEPATATERAIDMISAGSTGAEGDREWWNGQARRVLAILMHAAALGGQSMQSVLQWVSNPEASAREVTKLLRSSPEPAYAADAAQFLSTNARTQSSITATIMPALGWLTSPAASAATRGGTPFDVRALLRERGTVYLLGEENEIVAPLVAALTGYIAREARRQAARCPGGRLDPHLTLALDEAAQTCPVPLDRWTADMGGRGICIIPVFHSLAQMRGRWGTQGANTILTNAGATLLFGGTKGADLDEWVKLVGERDETVQTTNASGQVLSRTVRRVPVLSAAQLCDLPESRVMVKTRGMPALLGWAPRARRRRDVRRLTTQRRREQAAQPQSQAAAEARAAAQPVTRHPVDRGALPVELADHRLPAPRRDQDSTPAEIEQTTEHPEPREDSDDA